MKGRKHASWPAVLLLAACGVQSKPMRVELDVFSGRPNPNWQMTADETRAVADALAGLQEAPAREEAELGGLGFRGFLVTQEEGSPRQIRVSQDSY